MAMSTESLMGKLRWQAAAKLPGQPGWNKMKVIGKGLKLPNQSNAAGSQEATPLPENPFLRAAWLRALSKTGLPGQQKAGSVEEVFEKLANRGGALKSMWRLLAGNPQSGKGTLFHTLGFNRNNAPDSIRNLVNESSAASRGLFQQTGAGGALPALMRAGGGGYVGSLFDSDDSQWGSVTGALAALAGPRALRMLGNKKAPPGSWRRILSNETLTNRLMNDPLHRTMMSAGTGQLIDAGAGALGYETGGWGQRLGTLGGLAGGARPLAQILGGKNQTIGNLLGRASATRWGQAFNQAQTGGFTHLPAWMMGSPYARNSGIMAMVGHGIAETAIGEPVRNLAEKKKMLTETLATPEFDPAKRAFTQLFYQCYGPNARLYDSDGLPSREAIYLIQQMSQYGMMNLQKAGQRWFGDPTWFVDPNNWERLASPLNSFHDFTRGQASKLNPLPF